MHQRRCHADVSMSRVSYALRLKFRGPVHTYFLVRYLRADHRASAIAPLRALSGSRSARSPDPAPSLPALCAFDFALRAARLFASLAARLDVTRMVVVWGGFWSLMTDMGASGHVSTATGLV